MNISDTYTVNKAFEPGVQAHLSWLRHVRLLVVMNESGSIAESWGFEYWQ